MWETIRLAVSVVAYPAISQKHGETVCVAGIRTDSVMSPSWVRLYPFRGRTTGERTWVHKWDEIELRTQRKPTDQRPESLKPDLESIKVVGNLDTKHSWASRRAVVDPLRRFETMHEVLAEQNASGLSLAVVDPGRVLDLEITRKPQKEIDELSRKALQQMSQGSLFDIGDPATPLEPMPVDFYYLVQYQDEKEPRRLKIIDWEINQAWRKWRHEYADPGEAIRTKWLGEIFDKSREVSFFVGNLRRFPTQFVLLGVFWPPKVAAESSRMLGMAAADPSPS